MKAGIRKLLTGEISINQLCGSPHVSKKRKPLRPPLKPIKEDAQADSPPWKLAVPFCKFCGAYDHVSQTHHKVQRRLKLEVRLAKKQEQSTIRDALSAKRSLSATRSKIKVLYSELEKLIRKLGVRII